MYVSSEGRDVSFEGRYVSYASFGDIYDNECMALLQAYAISLRIHICMSLLRAYMPTCE